MNQEMNDQALTTPLAREKKPNGIVAVSRRYRAKNKKARQKGRQATADTEDKPK